MTMDFSAGNVLEHIQLNNMILAMNNDGVLDGLAVSERGAGANMSVDVASGNCYIDGTKYTEASTINLAIDASHATLYRKDLITYDPGTSNPVVTKGTDHAGGTGDPIYPPDIPAGDILLAIVDVDAAATTITNSDIHDGRITVKRNNVFSYSESDTLQKSDDTEENVTSATYVKIKELTELPSCVTRSSFRIKFSLKSSVGGYTVHGQIRRNGVLIGTDRSTSSIAYTEYSEDIDGWYGGDDIELWVKYATSSAAAYVKEFRGYGTPAEHTIIDTLSW